MNKNHLTIKKNFLGVFILFVCYGFSVTPLQSQTQPSSINEQEIPIYDFDSLESLLYTNSEKTYIVNFWAMWCAPCVKELPFFQAYDENNPDVEVLLISLDFPEDIEGKLKPFLQKKGITSKVVLLDDPDSNSWIDKIDPNWSGAIPFTIVFNNKKRSFYERTFESLEDLENVINQTFN